LASRLGKKSLGLTFGAETHVVQLGKHRDELRRLPEVRIVGARSLQGRPQTGYGSSKQDGPAAEEDKPIGLPGDRVAYR
jgi:hypothetical protein